MLDSLPNAQSQSRAYANRDTFPQVGRFFALRGEKTTYLKVESTMLPQAKGTFAKVL
jgi:hypothetical protein